MDIGLQRGFRPQLWSKFGLATDDIYCSKNMVIVFEEHCVGLASASFDTATVWINRGLAGCANPTVLFADYEHPFSWSQSCLLLTGISLGILVEIAFDAGHVDTPASQPTPWQTCAAQPSRPSLHYVCAILSHSRTYSRIHTHTHTHTRTHAHTHTHTRTHTHTHTHSNTHSPTHSQIRDSDGGHRRMYPQNTFHS